MSREVHFLGQNLALGAAKSRLGLGGVARGPVCPPSTEGETSKLCDHQMAHGICFLQDTRPS